MLSKVYFTIAGNFLLDVVDCLLSAKSSQPKVLSPFQEKELMRSFLNNSELTKDMKIRLSGGLGVTQAQVVHFFQTQSKKPIIATIEAYSKLLDTRG